LTISYNYLTPEQESVIVHKATEAPFTGEYDNFFEEGTYICRKCNAPLFRSKNKFNSGCGWPSFDGSFPNALKRVPDPDGLRTEIECANCGGHLGHEFLGEHLTDKNIRECVNSLSIRFIPKGKELSRTIHEQ
jgi:peptide-methionine (R)-S-oxide reductase